MRQLIVAHDLGTSGDKASLHAADGRLLVRLPAHAHGEIHVQPHGAAVLEVDGEGSVPIAEAGGQERVPAGLEAPEPETPRGIAQRGAAGFDQLHARAFDGRARALIQYPADQLGRMLRSVDGQRRVERRHESERHDGEDAGPAGALPGSALEKVIAQAKSIDMAKVHAEVESQKHNRQ